MDSVYADSSGTFGFHNLGSNPYYIVVNDDHYEPVRRQAVIDPSQQAPTVYLEITLVPRKKDKPDAPGFAGREGRQSRHDRRARICRQISQEGGEGI